MEPVDPREPARSVGRHRDAVLLGRAAGCPDPAGYTADTWGVRRAISFGGVASVVGVVPRPRRCRTSGATTPAPTSTCSPNEAVERPRREPRLGGMSTYLDHAATTPMAPAAPRRMPRRSPRWATPVRCTPPGDEPVPRRGGPRADRLRPRCPALGGHLHQRRHGSGQPGRQGDLPGESRGRPLAPHGDRQWHRTPCSPGPDRVPRGCRRRRAVVAGTRPVRPRQRR